MSWFDLIGETALVLGLASYVLAVLSAMEERDGGKG